MALYFWPLLNKAAWLTVRHERCRQVAGFGGARLLVNVLKLRPRENISLLSYSYVNFVQCGKIPNATVFFLQSAVLYMTNA